MGGGWKNQNTDTLQYFLVQYYYIDTAISRIYPDLLNLFFLILRRFKWESCVMLLMIYNAF